MENRLILSLLASLCLIAHAAANPAETEDALVEDAVNPENVDFGMPGMGQKMPSPSELLKMLDSMTGMSDEDKESLREDLLRNIQGKAGQQFPQQAAGSDFFGQTAMLLGFLSLLALIFVFFGYRLHKLLTEREVKREEKKRLKQMKKKK